MRVLKQKRGFKRACLLVFALWFAISSGWGAQATAAEQERPEVPEIPAESYVFDGMIPGDAYYFDQVMDVATDEDGYVYATERFGHRIVKLSAQGDIMAEWRGDESFTPRSIAVDEEGFVYVEVAGNVQKLDVSGAEKMEVWTFEGVDASGLAVDSQNGILYVADQENNAIRLLDSATGEETDNWPDFVDSSELVQPFEYPSDVALDGEGNVYVTDRSTRIVKLNRYGAYLDMLDGDERFYDLQSIAVNGEGTMFVVDYDRDAVFAIDSSFGEIASMGEEGIGAGQFDSPQGIAVSGDGAVYVADTGNRRVQKLAADALAIEAVWGTYGSAEGQFFYPQGLAVDTAGRVYVADQGNERIQLFDRHLQFIDSRDGGESYFSPAGLAVDGEGMLYITSDSSLLKYSPATDEVALLNESNWLSDPRDVAVDEDGNIYVADTGAHEIVKFSAAGERLLEMDGVQDPDFAVFRPTAIAVDSARGIVYSADSVNIQTFDTEGAQLEETWGEPEGGAFGFISGIALDGEGNLFVADQTNSRIQKFNVDGELVASWGAPGKGEGEFDELGAIAVDRAGNVYVTESGNHRVQKFAPATHEVHFESNGGSEVESQTVSHGAAAVEPASEPTRAGYAFGGWYADEELTEPYAFATTALTGNVTLYAKWTANVPVATPPPSGNTGGPPPSNEPKPTATNGEGMLVNGKPGHANIAHSTDASGRTITTVGIEWNKDNQELASGGQEPVMVVRSSPGSDALVAELSVELLKAWIANDGAIELRTGFASYRLEAGSLELSKLLEELGANVHPEETLLRIEVSRSFDATAQLLEGLAKERGFAIISQPVYFAVWLQVGDKQVELKSFSGFVKRTIAISSRANANRMTTGVVIEPNGTLRHVPTRLNAANGVYEAQIGSLTNSDYALIGYTTQFKDLEHHWAQTAVNDMGSRMIVSGVGTGLFGPDRPVTRAELAAMLVRALGLAADAQNAQSSFSDIQGEEWFAGAVGAAYAHRLIDGFEDGTFRPNEEVTREQAMMMIAAAMSLTGLEAEASSHDIDRLGVFSDAADAAEWAREALNAGLATGILTGKSEDVLAPKAQVTRAQATVMIQRLLVRSGLI